MSEMSFLPVSDLAAAIKAAGVRQASVDPAELTAPPFVYLKPNGIDYDLLDGFTLILDLVCVVSPGKRPTVLKNLAELLNKVTTVVAPDGTVTTATYSAAPGVGAGLPALVVPYRLVVS